MDGPRDDHTRWSKSEKDILQYCFYVEFKKYGASECIYKTDFQKLMVIKGEMWFKGRIN